MPISDEQFLKIQEQLARVDERTIYTGRDISDFKVMLERHRSESKESSAEIKVILNSHLQAQAARESEQDKKISDNLVAIAEVRVEKKRDNIWMYGIFLAVWSGLVAWIKYRPPGS
jgi:hypothetical protein